MSVIIRWEESSSLRDIQSDWTDVGSVAGHLHATQAGRTNLLEVRRMILQKNA